MLSTYFKSTQCLEFCTPLPSPDGPRKSPVFTFEGNEWFFHCLYEKCHGTGTWYFEIYLELHNKRTEVKETNGTFQVGFKNENDLSLCRSAEFKMSEHLEIWCIPAKELQAKLPFDYLDGNWIKFIFLFKDVNEPLKISKERDDKCVSTASYMTNNVRSLAEDFSQLLETGGDHDVVLKCRENTIKTHKLVLSARSDVFRAMLDCDMIEGRTGLIEIHEMDVSCFQEFTRYLYTDEMPELNIEKAKALYLAGDKYNIRSLVLRCAEYLKDILCPENAFEIYVLADTHTDEKLKDAVKAYLLEEEIYLQSEHWMPFYKNFPDVALEVYRLSHEKDTPRKKKSKKVA